MRDLMTKPYNSPIEAWAAPPLHIDEGYTSMGGDRARKPRQRRRPAYLVRLTIGLVYVVGTLPLKAAIALCYLVAGFALLGMVGDVMIHLLVLLAPAGSPARQSFFQGGPLLLEVAGVFIGSVVTAVLLTHFQRALKRAAANLQS
jgi:hypothetical protein